MGWGGGVRRLGEERGGWTGDSRSEECPGAMHESASEPPPLPLRRVAVVDLIVKCREHESDEAGRLEDIEKVHMERAHGRETEGVHGSGGESGSGFDDNDLDTCSGEARKGGSGHGSRAWGRAWGKRLLEELGNRYERVG